MPHILHDENLDSSCPNASSPPATRLPTPSQDPSWQASTPYLLGQGSHRLALDFPWAESFHSSFHMRRISHCGRCKCDILTDFRCHEQRKTTHSEEAFHSILPWFGWGFFLWLEQKVPVPTQTYRAEGTWFWMSPQKATAVAQRGTPRQCNHQKNSRKIPCPYLGMTVQTSSPAAAGVMGGNEPLSTSFA